LEFNMTDKDRIAALERDLADLKAAQPKPQPTREEMERSAAEWRDQMHQLREGNASRVPPWLVRECAGGVTNADAQDLVRASHAPQGPSGQGVIPSSQAMSNVRPGGGSSGWSEARPLGPQPGIHHVDRLLNEADRRDREELVQRLGRK
jgi:hypothetical protein